MAEVDFDLLRRRIAGACRGSFDGVRASHPDEAFYVFALYTVDDAVVVNPSSNSEQAYQRAAARVMADDRQKKWLESHGISLTAFLLGDNRWSAYEWDYECAESEGFKAVNELVNNRGAGFYDESDPQGFVTFKAGVLASMVLALSDLNKEGYFGEGRARETLTVFCSVADSECAIWLEEDSARRLNPPNVFQRFAGERIRYIAAPAERRHATPGPVQAAYLSLVQRG